MADKKETKQPNAIQRFWRETRGELGKVNWPTREDAVRLTVIVLGVLIVMSIFLGGVDAGVAFALDRLLGIR